MRRTEVKLWVTAYTVSIGAHAIVLTALASTLAMRPQEEPRVELPAGEVSTLTVFLLTEAEVEPEPDVASAVELREPAPEVMAPADQPKPRAPSAVAARVAQVEAARERMQRWLESEAQHAKRMGEALADAAQRFAQAHVAEPEPVEVSAIEKESALEPLTEPVAPAAKSNSEAHRTPGVIKQPVASASNQPPMYPETCRRRGQTGTVLLRLTVEADGSVSSVDVMIPSGIRALDDAALSAARRWHFAPAVHDGAAIRCEIDLPINFVLKKR